MFVNEFLFAYACRKLDCKPLFVAHWFLLRCKQPGHSLTGLNILTIEIIHDMFTEKENNEYDGWSEVAGQADFDAF